MHAFNWICPYCASAQTVVAERTKTDAIYLSVLGGATTTPVLRYKAIVCANVDCGQLTLDLTIGAQDHRFDAPSPQQPFLYDGKLLPRSAARALPAYVPRAIREDYEEACRIRSDSPKASATLARRCIQGMIRDFAGITRSRLIEEIRDLRKQLDSGTAAKGVTHESLDAIDHVREIGNIGAHMEKDVNLIVEVDADEAQTLTDLIELLIDEWYIAREQRRLRLEKITAVGMAIKAEKKALAAPQPELLGPEASAGEA